MSNDQKGIELKPCPFCGGQARKGIWLGRHSVICDDCGVLMRSDYIASKDYDDPIKRWNHRPAMQDKCGNCSFGKALKKARGE